MQYQKDAIGAYLDLSRTQKISEIYIGVGCFVDRPESFDQQLPKYIKDFSTRDGSESAVAILFDPKFLRQVPHAVAAASEHCKSWKQDGYYHYCGNLTVVVVNEYLEAKSRIYEPLQNWIIEKVNQGGMIRLAVFTQPYLRVEENFEVIDMYHCVLARLRQANESLCQRCRYLHLAAYGMDNPQRGTRMWQLPAGAQHDQDRAILKEVARFKGEGPSFGVACYAAFPGSRFATVNEARGGGVDYAYIQQQVEAVLNSGQIDPAVLLQEEEIYLNEIGSNS